MKKLADTQVAVHHEDLNPPSKLGALKNIKLKAPKAVKSIAIAVVCITGGVVAGTAAQAAIGQQTVSDGKSGSVRAPNHTPLGDIKLDGSLGSQIQTYMNRHLALLVNDIRETNSNPTVSQRVTLQAQVPLQYGKLKLRNDTESGTIVFLHAPGEKYYSRYAYLPACSERDMSAEYSTRWRVSVDAVHAQQISVMKGGVLMVATSSLVNQPDITACNRGLRLQSQRVVATLTNRPHDYANILRATYRPVILFSTMTGYANKVDDIGRQASIAFKQVSNPETKIAQLTRALNEVDEKTLEAVTEVLSFAGRKANIEDKRELIEVAKFLKGDGTDLERASARLEQYLNDCYPVFANQPEALQFLTTLQKAQNLKSNIQNKVGPLLIASTESSGTETPNTSQPLKSVAELNGVIEAAPTGPKTSTLSGIKCVQDKPSVMKHPSSTI